MAVRVATDGICVPNIGPRERRRRQMSGVVFSLLSVAIAAGLFASGTDRAWRVLLFLPLAAAANGFLQAQEKT